MTGTKFGIDVSRALTPSSGFEMRVTCELALRTCCLAIGLLLARGEAAEPVSPLMGITRDQVLSRYGEPRSQMAQGDRLVFIYPRERVIFRGDVVVEVEAIIPEPVRRPPPAEAPPPGPDATEPAAGAAPAAAVEPGPAPAVPGPAPSPAVTPEATPPPPPPEPKVEIKLVRPPGSKDLPPAAVAPPSPPPVAPPRPVVREEPPAKVPTAPPAPILAETIEARRAAERAAAAEKEQKARAMKDALRRLDEAARTEQPSGDGVSFRTWLIVGAALAGVGAGLYWFSRRRPVELAPAAGAIPAGGIAAPSGASAGSSFTPEMIEDLDGERFERLVVSYYSKTGVVAAPTRAGPDAPVQIKISWKGEPRPFAYVRCVTNSAGLVDIKPLKELEAALAADDIRRGYVVTPGRFTPAARGLAVEQQLTLLPGDLLLEKLNALPDGARRELMREISPS